MDLLVAKQIMVSMFGLSIVDGMYYFIGSVCNII
jgi:hypothetical protein